MGATNLIVTINELKEAVDTLNQKMGIPEETKQEGGLNVSYGAATSAVMSTIGGLLSNTNKCVIEIRNARDALYDVRNMLAGYKTRDDQPEAELPSNLIDAAHLLWEAVVELKEVVGFYNPNPPGVKDEDGESYTSSLIENVWGTLYYIRDSIIEIKTISDEIECIDALVSGR
jgi:hypothetical protein